MRLSTGITGITLEALPPMAVSTGITYVPALFKSTAKARSKTQNERSFLLPTDNPERHSQRGDAER